jgi:hypothetical protein
MRILFLLLISVTSFSQSFLSNQKGGVKQATTIYYISATGNDGNTGLSPAQAITTTKIASLSLGGKDLLRFKRGDSFTTGDIPQSVDGLNIAPYGTGAMPKIYGSSDLSGATWASVGSGVWSTVVGSTPKWIYVNGAAIGVAASNTFKVASISAGNIITLSSTAPISGYGSSFVGAKVRGFASWWILTDEYTVTAYNSGTGAMTLDKNVSVGMVLGGPSTGNCFMYMQQQFLTTNTWYFNSGTSTLYVKTLSGSSPAGTDIRMGIYDSFISNQMQIEMDSIELLNYHSKVISYTSWSYIHHNLIHDCRGVGLFGNYGNDSRINNNTIHHCDLNGIFSFRGDRTFYLSNVIYDICSGSTLNTLGFPTGSDALEVGTGTYPNSVSGIEFEAYGLISIRESNTTISKNELYNLGYVGIYPSSSNNALIDKNYVHDHVGTFFMDGGLIYTAGASAFVNNGNTISNNILAHGGGFGGNPSLFYLYGIYVDNFSSNISLINNSILDGGYGGGIFVNSGTKNTTGTGNNISCVGFARGGIAFAEVGGFPFTNVGNVFSNNKVAMLGTNSALYIQQAYNPFNGGGFCDNNNYVVPYAANITIVAGVVHYSVASWRSVFSNDLSSTERVNYITYSNLTNSLQEIKMELNWSDTPESFNVPAGYTNETGGSFSNPVTIAPYSSLMYFKNTSFP